MQEGRMRDSQRLAMLRQSTVSMNVKLSTLPASGRIDGDPCFSLDSQPKVAGIDGGTHLCGAGAQSSRKSTGSSLKEGLLT
mmetsp:Transcript_30283/g.92560  ORF Transcript_30283/g.92560 Transcript_30283/m.92560 type:complete len:81 (+) Transcript_30283:314-556(+)|eukprot:scaffold267808_cov25-Tisochrysis_lutea.AAC.2